MGNIFSNCMLGLGSCWFRDNIDIETDIKHIDIENKIEENTCYSYLDNIELETPIRYYCHHKTKRFYTI